MPNIFQQFLNQVNSGYKEADKRLGGWLPGGGTASPVTRAVLPPQSFPGRSKELQQMTGVKGRFVDIDKTPTITRQVAQAVAPLWGSQPYANPLIGEVGVPGYRGGATPRERHLEVHELGHLNPADKGIYSYLGTAGRFLQGVSNSTGNLPAVDFLAGKLMKNFDAPEEDRAERFAVRFATQGNYPAPQISPEGTSAYGDQLRREGGEMSKNAVSRILNPWGIPEKVTGFVNQQQASVLQKELSRSLPIYRERFGEETKLSPENLKESERLNNLAKQIEALGIEPKY
jgi:hypothetical protein